MCNNKMEFKVGDKIRMIRNCGNVKTGEILVVQTGKHGSTIYVENDEEHCSCQSRWELVDRNKTFKVGDKVRRTESSCGPAQRGEIYTVQNIPDSSDLCIALTTATGYQRYCNCTSSWELVSLGDNSNGKFKIGDRVKCVKGGCGLAYEEIGNIFRITSIGKYSNETGYSIEPKKGNSLTGSHSGMCGESGFEIVESYIQLNKQEAKMTTKRMINVLAVNKKSGKIEKDITVVAENEQEAILKAFGIDVENVGIHTTVRGEYEERKPQTVIVEKEKKQ